MDKDYINIVLTADNNYTKVIGITMTSVLENLDKAKTARFYIFSYKFTDNDIAELNKLKDKYDCEIINIPMEEHIHKFDFVDIATFRNQWISIAGHFRLLMFDILPETVEECYYLDSDLIINCDISKIKLDKDKIFIAVPEPCAMQWREDILKHCYEYPEFKKFQEDALNNPYFNSGFYVVNLKKSRELNIYNKIFDFFKEHPNPPMPDQDVLNVIFGQEFRDLVIYLSPEYNVFADIDYNLLYDNLSYDDSVLKSAMQSPKIIHFAGAKKPWGKNKPRYYNSVYKRYALISPWKNEYLKKEFLIKLSNILKSIFSLYNENNRKVICIFGIKFKFKRKG